MGVWSDLNKSMEAGTANNPTWQERWLCRHMREKGVCVGLGTAGWSLNCQSEAFVLFCQPWEACRSWSRITLLALNTQLLLWFHSGIDALLAITLGVFPSLPTATLVPCAVLSVLLLLSGEGLIRSLNLKQKMHFQMVPP